MSLLYDIFGVFNTYCVLLDKRLEYWPGLENSFRNKGINLKQFLVGDGSVTCVKYSHIDINVSPPRYEKSINYPTWFVRPNAFNCWISHRKIIQKSLEEDFDHVIIIEDDVFIEDDFDEVLMKSWNFFKENDWDSIYLGSYQEENGWKETNNANVLRTIHCCGWHAIILKKNIMEELLKFPPIGPMDYICSTYLNEKYETYAIYPSIISQKDKIHSFVENQVLEKPNRYKK